MKKYIFLSLLAAGFLSACASTNESTDMSVTNTNVTETSVVTLGLYEGVLPCADCDGIVTTLKLNADTTYDLTSSYQGKVSDAAKDEITYTNSGVYEKNGDIVKVITPSSGDIILFKVLDENRLLRVSEDGTEPMPELYDNYILQKAQ